MSDLISRQAALDAIQARADMELADTNHYYLMGFQEAAEAVESVPDAQPGLDEWCTDCKEYDKEKHCCPRWNRVIREALKDAQPERPTGQWLPDNNYVYETRFVCSVCGNSEAVPTIGFTKYKPIWDFCPKCGAEMDGVE